VTYHRMFRACLVLLALSAVVVGGAAALRAAGDAQPASPAAGDSNVLAVVNGENIDREQLLKVLMERYGPDELQQLIVDMLVNQEQKKYSVEVSDAEADEALQREVQQQIDNRKRQVLQQGRGMVKWEQYLEQMGTTEAQMRDDIKKRLLEQKDAPALLRRGVVLTKLAWYNHLTHDRFEVAHIQVETEAEANDAVKELNDGKEFAEVAQQRSRDQYTSNSGGQLAMAFSEGDYKIRPDIPGPEFERVVMSLKAGEVSAPVKSNVGWHIIKLISKEDAKAGSFKDLEPEVIKLIVDPRTTNIGQVYVWRLIRDAKIENKSGLKLTFIDQLREREEQGAGAKPAEGSGTETKPPSEKPAEEGKKPEGGEPAAPAAGGPEAPPAPESGP